MSDRPAGVNEVLDHECQLRLIEHMELVNPSSEPLDLWIDGFWAGVQAREDPRPLAELQQAIEMRRAVRLHQQGERHAHERTNRTAAVAPARRKSDEAAAELIAYQADAHGAKRDRDG